MYVNSEMGKEVTDSEGTVAERVSTSLKGRELVEFLKDLFGTTFIS